MTSRKVTHKSLWFVVGQSTDSRSMALLAFMFLYTICAITLDWYFPLILNLALWQSMHMFHLRIVCSACNRRDCEKIPARVELRKVTSRYLEDNCDCSRAWKHFGHQSNKAQRKILFSLNQMSLLFRHSTSEWVMSYLCKPCDTRSNYHFQCDD